MYTKWIFLNEWVLWIAALVTVLHQRPAWRLSIITAAIVFANGRQTVISWLRTANITKTYKAFYYFIGAVARKTEAIATICWRL